MDTSPVLEPRDKKILSKDPCYVKGTNQKKMFY